MSWLVDPAQRALTVALDGYARREQSIASNLANIDTPGYRASSVDFEGELAAAMEGLAGGSLALNPPSEGPSAAIALRRTDARHFEGTDLSGQASTIGADTQPAGVQTRLDGNGVDLEAEMTALAETQLKYSAVSRMLTGKLGMLRDVAMSR
jgi:flagellar basal-body rod protein FlgB